MTERDGGRGIVRQPPPSGPGDEVVDHAPTGDPSALGPRQYPEPPLPPELDDGVETAAAAPDTMTSCHTPPDTLRPLPLAWPGAVSPTEDARCTWVPRNSGVLEVPGCQVRRSGSDGLVTRPEIHRDTVTC